MEKKEQMKELILEGLSIIKKMGSFNTNTPAGPNTKRLMGVANKLYPLLQDDYPRISNIISRAEKRMIENGIINAFFFGDMRTTLNILKEIYCRPPKVFISHKSEDKPFVDALVKLLRFYIGSESDKIFCSSVPNYKIGLGQEIYTTIKSQFETFDIFFIVVHSPRYYQSPVCLNEMGASWIMGTECCSFLTKDCKYDEMNGVVDKKYISIKVNETEAKDRMNDFLAKILDFFNLPKPDISIFSQWEADRDDFLNTVCEL